jgi:hypothetical protein
MNPKFKKLYSYLKSNQMTDLDESTFYSKYSDPSKSKEIHSYLKSNKMTDLDETSFHSAYFGGKKKEPTELPSNSKAQPSLSDTSKKAKPAPSESSTSDRKPEIVKEGELGSRSDLFTGYPGKEKKVYRLDTSKSTPMWMEYSSSKIKGQGDSDDTYDVYSTPVTNPSRVGALNKHFKVNASTNEYEQTFTGYPGKEKNEYRVSNGKWQRKGDGKDWQDIYNEGSITALNSYFKQDVSLMKGAEKYAKFVENEEVKSSKNLQENLTAVNSKLIGQGQKEVAERLRSLFPGFEFVPSGTLTDQLTVVSPNGQHRVNISLDNWKDDTDASNARGLREFIRIHSNEKLQQAESKLKKAEQEADEFKPKTFNPTIQLGDGYGEIKLDIPESKDDAKKKNIYEVSENLKTSKAEYFDAVQAQAADIYDRQKAAVKTSGKVDDKSVTEAWSWLQSDPASVRRVNEYASDVSASVSELNKKKADFDILKTNIELAVSSGAIKTEEELEAAKSQLAFEARQLMDLQSTVESDGKTLSTVSKSLEKSIGAMVIANESKGSFLGGMGYKFTKGATNILRLLGDDETFGKQEQEGLVRAIVGYGTTDEYMSSDKRSDIELALFSLGESIGAMASGGGTPVSNVAFFAQSYYEMKDELDELDGVSDEAKVIMSTLYGSVSAVLEKFGLEYAMQKTSVGKNLVNNIIKSAMSDPAIKGASKEYLDAVIANSAKLMLAKTGLNIATSGAVEGITEGAQALTQITIKQVYDSVNKTDLFYNDKTKGEMLSDLLYESYLGAIGGGIMSSVSNTATLGANRLSTIMNKEQIEAVIKAAKSEGIPDAVIANLKASIVSGKISKQEAKQIADSFGTIRAKVDQMPEGLSLDQQSVSLDLMLEKDKLSSEITGKDESLTIVQRERIKEINNELQKISRDAVQEQATSQVPVQPETRVGEEVVEGESKTEPQVVAEEGKKIERITDSTTGEKFNIEFERIDKQSGEPTAVELSDGWTYVRLDNGEYTDGDQVFDSYDQLIELGVKSGFIDSMTKSPTIERENEIRSRESVIEMASEGTFQTLTPIAFWNIASDFISKKLGYDSPMNAVEESSQDSEILANLTKKAVEMWENGEIKNEQDLDKILKEGKQEEITIDKPTIASNATVELDRVKSVATEAEDGATFNLDGTKYEGGGLIVPVASKNTTVEEITPEMIADFVEENSSKIGDKNTVKFGIYKFPNSNEVSIDLNVVTPESSRDAAIEFGKKADQESLFDLSTFENVKTGGTGMNPKSFTDEQFKEIAKALNEGRVPNVFDEDVEIQDADIDADLESEVEALGQLIDSQDIDATTSTIKDSKIKSQVKRAAKALSVVAKGVKLVVHDTDASYKKATSEEGRSQSTAGTYDPNTKTIHINLNKANARTVAHEAFHAILLNRVTSDKQAAAVTKRMIDAISSRLDADSDLKKYLDDFASNYDENIQNEEKLAELVGKLAENFEAQPETVKDVIRRWINKLAQSFGLKSFDSDQEVMEVLNTIARKLATGKKIKEKDVSRVLGEKTVSVAKANKRFQADFSDVMSKMTFVYDKNKAKFDKLVKDGFITSDRSIANFDGKIMLLHQPDSAFSGEIYKNGELLVEGKGGMFYPIKFHEDGYFWASTSKAAEKMAKDLNKIMEQNGGSIYMALTTAPSEKLMSSTTMSNAVLDFFTSKSLDKNFKISKTQVRDAVRKAANATQVKVVKDKDGLPKEKLVGLDLKLKASLDINDITSAIKTALSSDNSSFEDRKTFTETLISNMADVIKSNPQAVDQFGKLFSEGIQNEYFKGVSKTGKLSISKANMVQALSNMLSEPILKDSSDGSGSVYAVIELNGPVKAVPSKKHESYPMAIQSADPSSKVKMHVLTDRVKWSNAFKDPNADGPITKENELKLFPTNTGVSKFGLVVDASGITQRNQISPDNSSNYANLTEDNDGNYVFYHYSGEQRQTIDPKKYGSKFTSRDEQAAISMVGGVSMYYTDPNTAEQGVGPVSHMVKIPKERVYDFNSDTDGLIKEAKSRFEAENPGKSFDPNTQLAYVTKIAEEKGYEMVVAQWVDKTRAQTTKEMTPVDVQVSEGNVIKKPFKENFESNKSKGWMSVIPKDKQEMLDKVYGKIYRDRNANDKYDDLYRLQEESVKYTQDKITEMIMNSDLSNELKSEYQEVLESEAGKRKSERKQISDFVDRKQNTSASSIVSIARAKGFSEAAIEVYLRKKGFSANEIASAMSVNDNVDVDKIFDRSKKAILDRYSKAGIVKSAQYLWNKIIDRQSDIKRIIKGIGSKQSKKAFNLLVTRAGAKGYANYRFKEASKKIYKNLKNAEIDILDKIIYARRIVSINENRAARGVEAYRGIDGYSEAEARRDLDRMRSELGDKKFNQINGRADEYFNVFSETLKNLYESGRITEDTYNNLKDIEYSPIATIKYIIGDNLSVDEIDRQAEIFGITRKDVMELTDRNENEIIMDSKWLLMMNLMSVEARAWENKMLNSFAEAIETADADTIKALSEYVSLGKPGGQVPAGFTSISYFKDGKPQSLVVRRDFASQLMDIKNRSRGLEAIGKMTGTQILRFFATGGNPLFIIGNTAVDFANILFMSNVYSSIKPIGAIQLSYDFASKFLGKIINDVSGNKKYKKLYEEFISHGGGMDFLSSDGLRELKRLRPTYKVTSAAQAVIVKYGNAMSYLGETSEQAMRLAVFGKVKNDLIAKYEKENGSKPTGQDLDDILYEAARESRETVDFSQGGDWTKSADLVMPYLNASMQGFRRPLDFMAKNPKGFASSMVQASLMAGGVAYMSVAALYRAVGDDDEDDKEKALKMKKALDSISVHEKASYHIIFTGKKNKDGEFEYYRIKKLPFLSVFTTAAEQVAYNQMFESLGSKYDVSGNLTKETIENSIPFAPSEIASRNPMISGLLTYHFNKDLFTGQEVFRKPNNLMVKPEDEGIYDDKVEGVYKYLAPKLGLSPIRTKAFVEKIITSPSTNPSVGVFYGVTSGLPIGEAFDQTMSNLGEDVTKKVIRFTNKKVLQYNQEDEIKKKEIEIESAIYRKESKIYNEIKKTYDNGGSMSTDKILSLVKENFDDIDVKKYFNKFYAYTRNKNLDRTVLDIIYEDVPESQAMRIFMKYGSTLDNEELKELGEVMYGAGIKIQPKTWYIYQNKYQNKK